MKISILVHDLASNAFVRVYPMAKVLQRQFDVEIIGACFGEQVFAPYQAEFEFKAFRCHNTLDFLFRVLPAMHQAITGDVIYAFKPRPTSYGVALLEKFLRAIPIVLDIEDWEVGWYLDQGWYAVLRNAVRFWHPNNLSLTWLMEKLVPLADQVIVVSSFLQRKFGGVRIVHGADTRFFDPKRYDRERLRAKWRVPQEAFVILFAGRPVPHKGVLDIVRAVKLLDNSSNNEGLLLLVGGERDESYIQQILHEGAGRVMHIGYQPHHLMPEFLALSDCVVLAQKPSRFAQAQVPGKVFEALAMGKPIVAGDISDLAEIVDGGGIIVSPNENYVAQLAHALRRLQADQAGFEQMSVTARKRAERLYSWKSMEQTLLPVFQLMSATAFGSPNGSNTAHN